MAEGALSSAGHHGAPGCVTGSWAAPLQPFPQDFALLSCPGSKTEQLSFLLRGPAWKPAASTIPSSKLPFPPSRATNPQPHLHLCFFSHVTKTRRGCCDGQNWSSSHWILMKGDLISTAKLFNEALKLQPQIMHIQKYAFVHQRGKISKTGSRWSALKANPCLPRWFPMSMCAIYSGCPANTVH